MCDQIPQMVIGGAERVVDCGESGGVVADRIFGRHPDAAVQLNRLLRDVAPGATDLQLGPRGDHRIEDAVEAIDIAA